MIEHIHLSYLVLPKTALKATKGGLRLVSVGFILHIIVRITRIIHDYTVDLKRLPNQMKLAPLVLLGSISSTNF